MARADPGPIQFVIKAREDLSLEGLCRTVPRVSAGNNYISYYF
mgnify:FL=1